MKELKRNAIVLLFVGRDSHVIGNMPCLAAGSQFKHEQLEVNNFRLTC